MLHHPASSPATGCSIVRSRWRAHSAAQRLGDLGADVIKVELHRGEWQRHAPAGGAVGNEINVSFLSLNRNKRSLAVDLKHSDGKEVLRELVASADVFLQNYRPGVAARLGVDYDTLREINPSLVYVSISGYGENGPSAQRPGQDLLLQAMSGAMLSAGREAIHHRPRGQYLVDAVTASTAFEGVPGALLHRERTGEGQKVTVNMLDSIVTLQMQELSCVRSGRGATGTKRAAAWPRLHSFSVRDFRHHRRLPGIIDAGPSHPGRPHRRASMVAEDPAWPQTAPERDRVFELTANRLKTRSTAHWLALFEPAGIWCAPVYGYADVLADPQIIHNETFIRYQHPTEGSVVTPASPTSSRRHRPRSAAAHRWSASTAARS